LQAPTRTLKPSQTCPACGAVKRKSLSDRVHVCAACGHTEPRDAAAARVILAWALRAVARVDGKRPVRDERMTGPERAEAG
ncbi:MAG TPA: zinc ribbon domain-containing protein, partial [Azospirillum sp.]|nr:zinc ribbon domain-containing protein [Azospirillum sp.]